MSSFNWESTIVDPFLSLDDSSLIPMLQDSYVSQPNPKSKDSSNPANPTHVTNSVSPPYTDSSPSPSSANEDNESRPNGDTDHTRKASVDDIDIDEQRPSLSPISPDNRPKRSIAPSRRKSGGERIHDESKLLKRKEQNRAAQRAFRERKEKHVKDLEDKVAQLEAKYESQATDNENLRDMLNRLQSENALLRQAAFSLSLPNGSALSNASSSNTFPEPGPSRTRTNSTSNTAPQIRDSQPTFNLYPTFESTSTSNTLPDSTSSLTDADLDSMALFGGPFTTVASNPMFMSYRDPTESMNAFASFGGWDDMSLANTFDQFSGLSNFNAEDITATQKPNNTMSSYDSQFQAALGKKGVSQDLEPCLIDQLCIEMQRKATCSSLH